MMPLVTINFPNIDPVLLHIGPLSIKWYSIAYIIGILFGWYGVSKTRQFPADKKLLDSMLSYSMLGILIGGRLGYVLCYNIRIYLQDPVSILEVWQGGMSFHGGAIGIAIALFILCKRNHLDVMPVLDLVACFAPIGLFLGRIANFINGELWGKSTDVPWAVIFPLAGPCPRHPTQIYEAILEGLLLLSINMFLLFRTKAQSRPGLLTGITLLVYACTRIIIEFFREPDSQIGYLLFGSTMGQLLSLPMILLGVLSIIHSRK